MVIQNHYSAACDTVFPKCDDSYRSSDAYKYPDCYKLVKQRHSSRYLKSGDSDIRYNKRKIILTSCAAVTAFFACCLALHCISEYNIRE